MLTATAGAEASSLDFSWEEVTTHAAGILGYIVHVVRVDFQFSSIDERRIDLPFGARITGREVFRLRLGDAVRPGTSLMITNLQPATTFKARIRAVSAGSSQQRGAWSATVTAATSNGAPGPPFLDEVVGGHKLLTVRWSKPNNGGSRITGYKVRWTLDSAPTTFLNPGGAAGDAIPGDGSVRKHVVTGLINEQDYFVEIAAVNRHGTGGWLGAQGFPEVAGGICLGNVAIPDFDACIAAADAGYSLSKNLSGEQDIVVTAVQGQDRFLPVATVTLRATDGDNAIQGGADIEGSLPALDSVTFTIPAGGGAGFATFSLTPKASGDGGSLNIAFTLVDADFSTDSERNTAFIGTVFSLVDGGIRITAADAGGTCPAAHNAAVNAFMLEEGGDAAGVCVSLASDPGASAPVSCAVTNTELLQVSPPDLTAFTSANWQTAQPVMVSAPDNDRAVAADSTDTLVCTSSAASGEYADASVNAAITISDTDAVAATGTLTATASINENGGAQDVTITATLDAGALPSTRCFADVNLGGSVAAGEIMAVVNTDFELTGVPFIRILPGESSGSATFSMKPIPDNDADTELISFLSTPQVCSGTASVDFGGVTVAITDFDADFDFGMLDGVAGADAADGLLVARYLAGARGADLAAGLNLTDEAVAAAANSIARNMPLLDVDGVNGTTMADGIMIARYFLGVVSGAGLTDGQADSTQEQTVTGNIMKNLQ
ncbi:MAG: fibronectin type III domain-containing protein [Gammaproteobacteria bacterium]